MATARCYTKSGSIEKYESNLWKSPIGGNWSSLGIVGSITTPDSNGNYTVTAGGGNFIDSDAPTEYYCFTEYAGVKKTFYFKKIIVDITINFEGTGYQDYKGNLVFNCTVSSNEDTLAKRILDSNQIIISYRVVDADASKIIGDYTKRVKFDMTMLEPGVKYSVTGRYYIAPNTFKIKPDSGTYDGYDWNILYSSVS